MDEKKKDEKSESLIPGLGRRDLIKKLGAGVVATALSGKLVSSQRGGGGGAGAGGGGEEGGGSQAPAPPPGSAPSDAWRPHTGPGFQNTYGRYGQNGQMDDSTRAIVEWVSKYNASDMTPGLIKSFNRNMVDTMAAVFAGFEEEATRVSARAARLSPAGKYKSTVFGYGFTATPELATFANSVMVRLVDFNGTAHTSNLIPAALAMGEALHKSGPEVMAAIIIGFQVPGGEPVGPAMAAGKLMGLSTDQLGNAVTLALTPHVALNKGVGAMSMWKGCRSAEAVKCGIWGAILAQQGMTGPPQPFEGRGGLWYSQGRMGRVFTPPVPGDKMAIERVVNKRFPSDQMTQQTLALMPQVRAWTKPEEVEWIEYYMPFGDWEEVGDAPKWDPRNRDTADHSIPYTIARNIISGESYLDAFSLDKLPFRDPQVKDLINRITLAPVAEWNGNGVARIIVHKKSGDEKYWDTHNGSRDPGGTEAFPQMSDDDITAKFKRVCAYRHIDDAQRDKALEFWWNLSAVKDIAEPMQQLAKFGKPLPL